ncbi:hypothetical protein D9619_011484 [Psilocybe cf. subviscida]|uniref:NACHT domain-containing protein n=1 Tax=Psilocybe cf. subviscida TaxID=2480587 RepID=A0A8H5BTA8_9AGAR|nr:hypothetical protein D9619_011484 [Psilocybe cf. subviscida]
MQTKSEGLAMLGASKRLTALRWGDLVSATLPVNDSQPSPFADTCSQPLVHMKAQLSLLENPGDVRIKKIVVDGRVTNVNAPTGDPLDKLYERVSHNAILNSSGRADEVRCYPGTRKDVIQKIENWKNQKDYTSRMMWLSGPAGAGKTAIVQTVAEGWKERRIPVANFFFFRADGTRNTAKPIIATLLYQLFDHLPALKESAANLLSGKPLMCKESLKDQFVHFIYTPIHTLTQPLSSDLQIPIVLLVDGLDECSSDGEGTQERLLHALHDLVAPEDSPFMVLVASRREHNLIMAFNKLPRDVTSIYLDDGYRSVEDIRRFVEAKFNEIKGTHHLAHNLRADWPLDSDIDNITTKSSGQFIYAATVMRFLEQSSESPHSTLKIIQGIQPAENYSPFSQLDAMYSYIFSQGKNPVAIRNIFAMHLTAGTIHQYFSKDFFEKLLATKYDFAAAESILSPLSSIVRLERGKFTKLVFYHASLGEFLLDESRSGTHFLNMHKAYVKLIVDLVESGEAYVLSRIYSFIKKSGFPTEASDWCTAKGYRTLPECYDYVARVNADTVNEIYERYANSDISQYKKLLRRWVFLMAFFELPLSPHGLINRHYILYKLLIKLEVLVYA